MIFTDQSIINDYTKRGWWGKETLSELFDKLVSQYPDRLALVDPPNRASYATGGSERLTYRQLNQKVIAYSLRLIEAGVDTDDIVVYQLPNIHEIIVVLLACNRVGAIASPVLVQFGTSELASIFSQLKPKALVSTSNFKQKNLIERSAPLCAEYDCVSLELEKDFSSELSAEKYAQACDMIGQRQKSRPITANDITTICWTSGTEGAPKGVMRSHNQWVSASESIVDGARMRDGDVLLNARPVVNMAAIGGGFYPWLLIAGTMVLHHPLDSELVLKQIEQEQVNITFMPPAFVVGLLKDPKLKGVADLSSLRTMGSGSAAIPEWAVEQLKEKYGVNLGNFFGSNEGVSLLGNHKLVPDAKLRATYFARFGRKDIEWPTQRVSARVETRLVDLESNLEITEPGCPGELRYKGTTIFSGYFDRPDLTKEAFDEQGYYRSGDLFEIAGDGDASRFYRFVGRCKEVIIRGGFNIAPAEIDGLLSDHPAISEVAAFSVPDDRLGELVGVAVVPESGQEVLLDDIISYLKSKDIAVFKLPERLLTMDELPRNGLLKVLRWRLTEIYSEQGSKRESSVSA